MTTPDVRTASEEAAARAKQAHGGVPSGDNDPAATDHLKAVAAAVDILVPRIEKPVSGRAMCSDWGYDRPAKREQTVQVFNGVGQVVYEHPASHPNDPLPGLLAAENGLARLVRSRTEQRRGTR